MVNNKYVIKLVKINKPGLGKKVLYSINEKIFKTEIFLVCVFYKRKNLIKLGYVEKSTNLLTGISVYKCNINKLKLNLWLKKGVVFCDFFFYNLISEFIV